MNFAETLATARKTSRTADEALALATQHTTPISAEDHALYIQYPQDYAKALRKIADILDTLPALRVAAQDAQAALAPLRERACTRCNGTGVYAGPSNATRQGVAYCFYCNGTGDGAVKAARRG